MSVSENAVAVRGRTDWVRLLGVELRKARDERGWTRQQVVDRAGLGMAVQTLASYENGTRAMPTPVLFELAETLGVTPDQLVADTYRQARPADALVLDVKGLAADGRPRLAPAQAWAASRLHHQRHPGPLRLILTEPALNHLAALCGVAPAELKALLVNQTSPDEDQHGD
ncbi:MAG TPA: helix-turn-helix transcriptional regulator [Pseudonocardiaceae bacterium]